MIGNVPGVADPLNGNDIEKELEDIRTVVSLENLSNFMFNLDLKWTEDCVLTEKPTREFRAAEDGPPALDEVLAINRPKYLKFSVIDCKFYVPIVTLQTEYQNQL